jgi:hypothetical protein
MLLDATPTLGITLGLVVGVFLFLPDKPKVIIQLVIVAPITGQKRAGQQQGEKNRFHRVGPAAFKHGPQVKLYLHWQSGTRFLP